MEGERARIQKLLEEGKITEEQARKLLKALEQRRPSTAKSRQRPPRRRAVLYLFLAGIALFIAVVLMFFSFMVADYNKNLLVHPDFETGADGMVSSWMPSEAGAAFLGGRDTGEAAFVWDEKVSHSGRFSISIRNKGRRTLSWRQQIKVFPRGKKLRLRGFIRSQGVEGSGAASLVIRGLRGLKDETFVATSAMSYDLTGSKDWTPVQVQALVTDDTEEIEILCELKGRGAIWCDDLDLRVVD